jgi:hypothetical protein
MEFEIIAPLAIRTGVVDRPYVARTTLLRTELE